MWTLLIIALAFVGGYCVGKFGVKDLPAWLAGIPALLAGYWEQITGLFS